MVDLPVNIDIVNEGKPSEHFISYLQSLSTNISVTDLNNLALIWSLLMESSNQYVEFSYNDKGNLTKIEIWTDSSKTTKLYTKTISYLRGKILQIQIKDESTSAITTKTFTYNNERIVSMMITT